MREKDMAKNIIKSFKIGEYAIGGIIKVEISKDKISVSALDWNTKKIVANQEFDILDGKGYFTVRNSLEAYLNELTSSFHVEKIMDHVKTHVQFYTF